MHNHNGRHMWWMMLGCLLPLGALFFRDYIPGRWLGPLVILLMVGMHIPMFFGGKKEQKEDSGDPDKRP